MCLSVGQNTTTDMLRLNCKIIAAPLKGIEYINYYGNKIPHASKPLRPIRAIFKFLINYLETTPPTGKLRPNIVLLCPSPWAAKFKPNRHQCQLISLLRSLFATLALALGPQRRSVNGSRRRRDKKSNPKSSKGRTDAESIADGCRPLPPLPVFSQSAKEIDLDKIDGVCGSDYCPDSIATTKNTTEDDAAVDTVRAGRPLSICATMQFNCYAI